MKDRIALSSYESSLSEVCVARCASRSFKIDGLIKLAACSDFPVTQMQGRKRRLVTVNSSQLDHEVDLQACDSACQTKYDN